MHVVCGKHRNMVFSRTMFSVLIAEDEILARIGLKNMIDWAGMDMKVVGEARNGKAALEIYQKQKPDLILTDIKMPVMDGLEMIAEIRKSDKHAKIVIFTCHQEFDLLHEAIRLGVTDYILKNSMSMEEIQAVIRKVRSELTTENKADAGSGYFDPSLAKEDVVKSYLFYGTCSDAAFEKLVKKLNMKLEPANLTLCIMRIDGYETRMDKSDPKYEATIRDIIGSLVRELLDNLDLGEIVNEREGRYFLLLNTGDTASRHRSKAPLPELLGRISQIMKTYADTTVTFGISSVGKSYSDLKLMYGEALSALAQSYYAKDARYLRCGDERNKRAFQQAIDTFRDGVLHTAGLVDGYRAEILSGIERLGLMFGKPAAEAAELLTRLVTWPATNLKEVGSDSLSLALDCAERVHACSTIDEAIEAFLDYLRVMVQARAQTKVVSREVAEAMDFIRLRYERDISLLQVAQHVEMSPNYLSSLFKKELRTSFVGYLNRVRIDKAGELLKSTHLKLYAIAERVGFADESYFSRIFKRIKGVRPGEYKKMRV